MKKRFISVLLVLILVLSICPITSLADGGLSNFTRVNTYRNGQFTDVPSSAWFAENVATAYELGLMLGSSDTFFNAAGNVTIGETITMSARIHSIYATGAADFEPGTPWFRPYVDYALANGIITREYADYTQAATRADFASILRAALPDEALEPINTVADGAIPDVNTGASYAKHVYTMYRAGILVGNDALGTFTPASNISRSAAAAIVTRMADPGLRLSVTLGAKLDAEGIFAKCSPAVFYIELYDETGAAFASGSGFFISSSGVAVTNYHVIEDAYSAKILTSAGGVYDVAGAYDYSEENDLALLQIDGSGFPYLDMGDSSSLVTGSTVYAIGSPRGLDNTISQGIISNADRPIDGVDYIQFTASISPGSSGGALLNTAGQVIGVPSLFIDGQNLNLAVPINLVSGLDRTGYVALSSLLPTLEDTAITASSSVVTVKQGSQATIIFAASIIREAYWYYEIEDSSVISYVWGEWTDEGEYLTMPLTVMGLFEGSTVVTVTLYDYETDVELASASVYIIVTRDGSTTYYAA